MEIIDFHAHIYPEKIADKATHSIIFPLPAQEQRKA